MSDLTLLDQDLADTLEAHRRKEGMPPLRAPVGDLARDIVGQPRAPKDGACCYCGARAPGRTVCAAHEDLVDLDAGTSAVVTNSTGGARTILGGSSASTPARRVTP